MTDDLTDGLQGPPDDLAVEIRGMRQDFRDGFARLERERVGRRGTNRLAAVVIIGALFVAGAFGVNYLQQGRITCDTRIASRADTRAGIEAAADEVAAYAELTGAERDVLRDRVAARVLVELPDPC